MTSKTTAKTASTGKDNKGDADKKPQTPNPVAQNQPGVTATTTEGAEDPKPRKKARKEEEVECTVPHDFTLKLDDGTDVQIKAGKQFLPVSHAEHWYVKAHGVTQVDE